MIEILANASQFCILTDAVMLERACVFVVEPLAVHEVRGIEAVRPKAHVKLLYLASVSGQKGAQKNRTF